MPLCGRGVQPASEPRQFGGEHQAHRDRGAMAPPITLAAFDGVGKCVPVVEDLPQRRFLLVGSHHRCLDFDGPADQHGQHRAQRVQRCLWVGLDQLQYHRIGDETGLDHLGHACHQLVAGQRLQHRQVNDDGGGLMERPDQVLPGAGVDTGLATDGGVDHRQQCGRHVNDVHPAQPGGRGKSGDIGGGTAAKADDRVLSANSDAAQHFPQKSDDLEIFTGLRVRQFDPMRVDAVSGQMSSDRFGGLGENGLMQYRHPVSGTKQFAQLAE